MAEFSFTEQGYIEVYCDGVMISQHRQEREAVEKILSHSAGNIKDTVYVMKKPPVQVIHRPPHSTTGIISGTSEYATA